MTNGTSLVSVAGPSVHVARINAFDVGGPVTCQSNIPTLAVMLCIGAPIVSHDTPPSRESSTLMNAAAPRLWFHLINWVEPMVQCTAMFGTVTVTTGGVIAGIGLGWLDGIVWRRRPTAGVGG